VAARRRQRDHGRRPRRASSGPPGPGTFVIVLVGVVLVIFAILGLTGGGGSDNSTTQSKKQPAKQKHKQKKKKQAPPKATTVTLRAVPVSATYMCVDRGPGTTTVYQGTTTSPQTFKGKRVRINAGNDSVKLVANKKRVRIPSAGQSIGYDFRLRHDGTVSTRAIPLGQRPCA
jgi:hypothetical protein